MTQEISLTSFGSKLQGYFCIAKLSGSDNFSFVGITIERSKLGKCWLSDGFAAVAEKPVTFCNDI